MSLQSVAPKSVETMREDIRLEVASDARFLESIRAVVRTYVTKLGLSNERVAEIVLAVDEACSNSIRHAYEGQAGGRLYLSLRSNAKDIEVVLRDKGTPAPPERTRRKELTTPTLDALKPGGLGVQLMYTVFDEVEFERGKKTGNCITMRLKRAAHDEKRRDSGARRTRGTQGK